MAIISDNTLVNGLSGAFGGIVFRQLRGKTVLSIRSSVVATQSEQQRKNRSKFKSASAWAKAMMLIPEKKSYYVQRAKKLKLPNGYTAALSDYMRKGEITKIDTHNYKGKAGDVIQIATRKKGFTVDSATVAFIDANGRTVESGSAQRIFDGVFNYKVIQDRDVNVPVKMRVTIYNHGLTLAMQEQEISLT
jgi:hypothetical protein